MELDIASICEAIAVRQPEADCLVFRDRRFSWADVQDRTRRLAAVLRAAGLGSYADQAGDEVRERWTSHQDHVALYLLNGNEYLEGMLGSWKARCAPFNVNYRYVAEELKYLLDDSGARAIIVHERFTPVLAAVLDQGAARPALILQVADGSGHALMNGALDYEAALAAADPELPAELVASWSGDDLYLCYTGGTTGMPKGAMWRQADFLVAALGVQRKDRTDFDSLDEVVAAAKGRVRALPAPPLMHGAAHWNALSAWIAGGAVIIQDVVERFDPADVLDTVSRHRATSLLLVGDPMIRPLVDQLRRERDSERDSDRDSGVLSRGLLTEGSHPRDRTGESQEGSGAGRRDLSSLRHLLSGGAVLSPGLKAELLELLPDVTIVDVLGSTESGRQGVSQVRTGDDTAATFSSASTAAVLSEDLTRRLSPGEDELGWLAQSGRVPLGYLGDRTKSEATFPVIDGVRYAIPGDRARLLADGSLELRGRDSVCINTGGEKVFAEEVETAVKAHPAVFDAVVCGRPSERFGAEVVAIVQLRDGEQATDDELRAVAATHIARYKLPRVILRRDLIVRAPSGKADYRWAVAEAISG